MAKALEVFRDPASVAVVGASDDPGKWGYWLARGALRGRERRSVALVNQRGAEVQGSRTFTSLAACETPPQLVVLSVPGQAVKGVVDQALELGATGFLAVNGAIPRVELVAERIRRAGARLIGPNSLGLFDAETALQLAWGGFEAGSLAVVSQSGQIGTEICGLAAREGLGVSRFVSIGNQLDVTAAEVLDDLLDHDATRVVALYLETLAGAETLLPALRALHDAGKPVLMVAVGGSRAGQQAAASHTGAVTTPLDAVDALCRAAGALRVATPSHLVAAACMLARHRVRSRRVAVVGDSGGQGALAADILTEAGLHLPEFSTDLQDALARELPPAAATQNPVDLAGAGEQDLATYARLVHLVAESEEVDAVVLTGYFGRYGLDAPSLMTPELEVADDLVRASALTPVVVHTMGEEGAPTRRLRTAGVPVYGSIDHVARALAAAATLDEREPRSVPAAAPLVQGPLSRPWDLRTALRGLGVPFPPGMPVGSASEASVAAEQLRAPLVLKAAWLPHKTEHGGVRLDLTQETVAEAFRAMHERLGDGEYLLEEQDRRSGAVEVLVGARRVPGVGPVVVVGAGGVRAELMPDVAMDLAPVTSAQALDLLSRLHVWPLLTGWRGSPALDVRGLADVVAVVSATLAGRQDIAELEVNPVRVGVDGVLAVDAAVHLRRTSIEAMVPPRLAHAGDVRTVP